MELNEAILTRRSVRAYRSDPVSREIITSLLELARWAPSGSNSQPWRVTIVQGAAMEAWRAALIARQAEQPWDAGRIEAFNRRVRSGSLAQVETLAGRSPYEVLAQGSMRLYDAPAAVVLSFAGDGARTPDGIPAFVTTFMLAAHQAGLGTCWLGFIMGQPDLLRQYAQLSPEEQPAAVFSLGYPDLAAPTNRFHAPRTPATEWTRWVE